jgi:hypothetical protein
MAERTYTEQAHPNRTPQYLIDRVAANDCTVAGCEGKMTSQHLCDTCNRPHPLAGARAEDIHLRPYS